MTSCLQMTLLPCGSTCSELVLDLWQVAHGPTNVAFVFVLPSPSHANSSSLRIFLRGLPIIPIRKADAEFTATLRAGFWLCVGQQLTRASTISSQGMVPFSTGKATHIRRFSLSFFAQQGPLDEIRGDVVCTPQIDPCCLLGDRAP